MNILYVTPYVPSRIRTRPYNLIRALCALGHQVTLLTAGSGSDEEQGEADELRQWGVQVEVFCVSRARSLVNCLRALPTRVPLQAMFSYHPGMERRLSELLVEQGYGAIHVEHLRAARLARSVRTRTRTPVIYDSVDCISSLFEQAARISSQRRSRWMARLDLARTRRYEAGLLTRFDQVVITSARDKAALEALADRYLPGQVSLAPVTVVGLGVDLAYFGPSAGERDERTIVFSGKMSYHANISAVDYFCRDVLPLIWERDPRVRFEIVGKDPPEGIRQLAGDSRIHVTGYVDDLRPYLARATVAVCPVRYAVGVQSKVLEAMAMGTPTVSTPEGCAALAVSPGSEILVGEGDRGMADAILRVLSDPVLAGQLSSRGREYVKKHHSWTTSARKLIEVYQEARAHKEPDRSALRGGTDR